MKSPRYGAIAKAEKHQHKKEGMKSQQVSPVKEKDEPLKGYRNVYTAKLGVRCGVVGLYPE